MTTDRTPLEAAADALNASLLGGRSGKEVAAKVVEAYLRAEASRSNSIGREALLTQMAAEVEREHGSGG